MAPQGSGARLEQVRNTVSLTVNGTSYNVEADVPPWTRLVDFLRERVKVTGTKALCREGGCGVCTVVATVPDLETPGRTKTVSLQSCQALLYACQGWSVETVESLGDRWHGYHQAQTALHGFYGTQCGYCSPGMIMTMYGQLQENEGQVNAMQVERAFDGNLCRCTGYRPILDAFKSLSLDADQTLKDKLTDIEDAYKSKCGSGQGCGGCKNKGKGKSCSKTPKGLSESLERPTQLSIGGVQWYYPTSVQDLYNILNLLGTSSNYRIVVGNTGAGVYKNDGPYSAYISSGGVPDLYTTTLATPIEMGANVSLTRALQVFDHMATMPGYHHLKDVAQHWRVVANTSVRNTGSWAGNLMMKHQHNEFQSDIWLTLLMCGAELTLGHAYDRSTSHVDLETFLKTDMSRSVILSISIPPVTDTTKVRTFKITPRFVNAHAYVNACFRMDIDANQKVIRKPTIIFGGINPDFIHASRTEDYLTGRTISDPATVVEAARILGEEVQPDSHPQDATPKYRRQLTQCLLYKTVIGFLGPSVPPSLQSATGNILLERPLSSGQQTFDMNEDTWPVGEPLPKLESAVQISGEAEYLDDVPYLPDELHGAFVLTTVANAKIRSVNTREAMKLAGVVDYVTTSDIPGRNSFVSDLGLLGPDPVFVGDRIKYAGQPIGLMVAKDRDTALRAARLVVVEYEDVQKPVLTIKEAEEAGRVQVIPNPFTGKPEAFKFGDADGKMGEAQHQLSGVLNMGSQYHLHMESHAARVLPTEDGGCDVFVTTQFPTEAQTTAAQVLGIPANKVNVCVKRIGGGYGSKISRAHVVSTAAAVAAWKVKRPVRVVVDLNTNMTYSGWREPYKAEYEVGFEANGKLTALKVSLTSDGGHVGNEATSIFQAGNVQNVYYVPNYSYTPKLANTDTAANTWCRTPGHVEAIATMENIMEHIANYLKKDPQEIRFVNMVPPQVPRLMAPPHETNVVKEVILPLLKEKANFVNRWRDTILFNKDSRWRKRGLSIVPMWYDYEYQAFFKFGVQVAIFQADGSVAVSHGGIEMGQGINTKIAQVAAYVLGVPMDQVSIKCTDTFGNANSFVTGGSQGTDVCAHGVRVACERLKTRLDEVRARIKTETGKDPTWLEVVKKAYATDVDLCERYWTSAKEHPDPYSIWGAACLEVELDVLTGNYMVKRVDLIEDCGRSLSPYVDIGQVEGSFIMGLGMFSSEIVKYDPTTGQKLSNGTWEYKPPTALDIPVDFRVTLLPNAKNAHGVLGSKATGEPPLCMSYVFVTALRQAIASARQDAGLGDGWFDMDTPLTAEKVHQLCGTSVDQFKLSAAQAAPEAQPWTPLVTISQWMPGAH